MERLTRGSVINGWLKFIKKKWGADGLDVALKLIEEPGMLKGGKYYPDDHYRKLLEWIAQEHGHQYIEEGGKFIVKNLGLLSWLVRFASPLSVMERGAKHSSEVYKFGKAEIETPAEHIILVKLQGICYFPERCLAWKGVIEGELEMTKTKGTVEEISCENKGEPWCIFKVVLEG